MSTSKQRSVWQSPWGYAESIAIVVGVAIIGVVLQLSMGSFDFFILANPVNKITGLVLFLLSITVGLVAPRSNFCSWLSGVAMSVSLIVALLLLTIIMGLTPQVGEGADSSMALGFDTMTRNWSFVLLYCLTLISLGGVVVRRMRRFRVKDFPFMMQHIGLWLFLVASGLGYADMERYIMYVVEGETQWRVYDGDGNVKELPIAIHLKDFDMEVYPPRLAVVDRLSGMVQPEGAPQYFQLGADEPQGEISGWKISTEEYIHKAVRAADSTYREVPMPGSTPAVKITASRGEEQLQGWVCGGNQVQNYMAMAIDQEFSIVMTPADPREYTSEVEVYTQRGDAVEATIRVNHPLSIGAWNIYQYGYDNSAGSLSNYSSFELVYDPWLQPIYGGIILMMIGAVCMIAFGRNTKQGGV